MTFKEFKVTDAGGPLTIKGLQSGLIQAGNVFSTDPAIKADNLVSLEDPESLFGAQNVVPLIATVGGHPAGRRGAQRGLGEADHRHPDRAELQGRR